MSAWGFLVFLAIPTYGTHTNTQYTHRHAHAQAHTHARTRAQAQFQAFDHTNTNTRPAGWYNWTLECPFSERYAWEPGCVPFKTKIQPPTRKTTVRCGITGWDKEKIDCHLEGVSSRGLAVAADIMRTKILRHRKWRNNPSHDSRSAIGFSSRAAGG